MSARFQSMCITVAKSGTVSGNVSIIGAKTAFLWCPEVNSCRLNMHGSFDTTSSNFVPVYNQDGSTRWNFQVETGSRAIMLGDTVPFPFLRVELGVPQTSVRTFVIGVKLY